jgi:uncharacterized metal-binding protein YceD (DUF177 family)
VRPEFSRTLALAAIPAGGLRLALEAGPEERLALGRRLGLLALEALTAELALAPGADGAVAVTGRLAAEVVQECVVSLAPLRQQVAEAVAWRLLPEGMEPADGENDPDDIACPGGVADLGEALAQQLSLALDPYPRAPDARLPEDPDAAAAHGPFAALAKLKRPG